MNIAAITLSSILTFTGIMLFINLIMAMRSIMYRKLYKESTAKYDSSKTLSAAIFMPCKGIEEGAEEYLDAMLQQDYAGEHRVYFITESENDPATALLKKFAKTRSNASVVIAGRAKECCQKNHNLLAAIAKEQERDNPADIFVFADADVKPGKTWLKDLTLPMTDESMHATTAFRWLKPKKFTFWGTMHAMLSAYLGTLMSSSDGMWGGSMAIRRDVFIEAGVCNVWSKTASDDIALMSIIIKNNLKREFVPVCQAESESVINDGTALYEWFLRQVQYLKIHCPVHWITSIVLTGLNLFSASSLLAVAFWTAMNSVTGSINPLACVFAIAAFLIFMASLSLSRLEGKEGQSFATWLMMSFPSLIMGFASLIGSIFRNSIIWRGIRYGINPDGTVSYIKVEKENA